MRGGKSLRVIAGLAGISKSHLSRIERGEHALDSRSETAALANALQIAPSELTKLPVPAPGDGSTDAAVQAVRLALIAAGRNRPHGQPVPLDVLQRRVQQIRETRRRCGFGAVGAQLPGSRLGRASRRCNLPGVAAFGSANALLASGAFDLADAELGSLTLPPTTVDTAGMIGMVTMTRSLIAAADQRPGDVAAPMQAAKERSTQHNPFARDVIGELLARSRRDAVGRELRGMAYRAGLPV